MKQIKCSVKWMHIQIQRIFVGRSAGIVHRGIRHLIAGGIGTLIYLVLTFLFVELFNIHPVFAVIYSFIISVVYSYVVNKSWVYDSKMKHYYIIPRFISVILISLLLNTGIMYIAVEIFQSWYVYGLAITVFVVPPTNFLLNYYWAFK